MGRIKTIDEVREQLHNDLQVIAEMLEQDAYIIAGLLKGKMEYAYIGEGKGLNGTPLMVTPLRPILFASKEDAEFAMPRGEFRNGGNEVVTLQVVTSREYYTMLQDMDTDLLEFIAPIPRGWSATL